VFNYVTSSEAIEAQGFAAPGVLRGFDDMPDSLVWGMLPFGWRWIGPTLENKFDAWTPCLPGQELELVLFVPRSRPRGQYEVALQLFNDFGVLDTPKVYHFADPMVTYGNTVWAKNVTTRQELSEALTELDALVGDPDVREAYLSLLRGVTRP
jgi:hypothetical protein